MDVLTILSIEFNSGDNLEPLCVAVYKALDPPRFQITNTGESGKIWINNETPRCLAIGVMHDPTAQQLAEIGLKIEAGLTGGGLEGGAKWVNAATLPNGRQLVQAGESSSICETGARALITLTYVVNWVRLDRSHRKDTEIVQGNGPSTSSVTMELCTHVCVPSGNSMGIKIPSYTYTK